MIISRQRKQAEIFEQDLQQKDQEMYELKHELIALRMKIEETEKSRNPMPDIRRNFLKARSKNWNRKSISYLSKSREGIASVVLFIYFIGSYFVMFR